MSKIPQSSENNSSSSGSGIMNHISLDAIFSNLNQSLKNKLNSQNISNQNRMSNTSNNNNFVDFFKSNQNHQFPMQNRLGNNPNLEIHKNAKSNDANDCKCTNSSNISETFGTSANENFEYLSQIPKNELKGIKSVPNMHDACINSNNPIISRNASSNEINSSTLQNFPIPEKSDNEQTSQVKPISMPTFSFNFSNFSKSQQTNSIPSHFAHSLSNRSNDYRKIKISPSKYNFLPSEDWKNTHGDVKLESIISNFFHARYSSKIRFEYKLWNALQITLFIPRLFSNIGVKWASKTIIQVNQKVFGEFLDLKRFASALFTSNGSFPSHGFVEIPNSRIREELKEKITDAELAECRFLEHKNQLFRMDSTEDEIASIKLH